MTWRETSVDAVRRSVREAFLDAAALLLPVDCAGCGSHDRGLCAACRSGLRAEPALRVTAGGLRVVAALRYESVARRVILAFKESDRTDVAGALAGPLALAVGRALAPGGPLTSGDGPGVGLVAVPTSPTAYRRRGYDPVGLLLRRARLPVLRGLERERSTASQKTLDRAARGSNLRGAFVARDTLAGRPLLIVDDVVTTGSTLDEAARALRAVGAEVLGGVSLAFTPRLSCFDDKPIHDDYGGAKGAR